MKNLLIASSIATLSSFAYCNDSTTVFSWVDSDGIMHFTDEKPNVTNLKSMKNFTVQEVETQQSINSEKQSDDDEINDPDVTNESKEKKPKHPPKQNSKNNPKQNSDASSDVSDLQVVSPSSDSPSVINGIIAYKNVQDETQDESITLLDN